MNKLSKQEILKGLEDIKQLECNPEYKTKVINGILDLYNKEVEISHFNQSQLDIANAKILELEIENQKLKNDNQVLKGTLQGGNVSE